VTTDQNKSDVLIQDDTWRMERCHIKFRVKCADIKEVKTMNSKGWGKQ
jgi:hypothetical protein